ncbi:MAG TPA: DNA-binding response regulator [Rhodobacteraceae bacterium]|nr:DNA-binding response regulator [Paracoccaceae bacterium]
MTLEAPAHLLVVDTDERLRDLLRGYLKAQSFLVSVARDGTHARSLLSGLEFDLVVLDARLPDIRALCDDLTTPILLLTSPGHPAPGRDVECLEKPFEPPVLCARINTILDRRPPVEAPGPKVVRMGSMVFDLETGALTRDADPVRLTATEVQLMRVFAAQPGVAVGRGEVIARLGREGLQAKARAIDVQITRLRRKLEDDPKSPKYLQTVRGAGYMLVVD